MYSRKTIYEFSILENLNVEELEFEQALLSSHLSFPITLACLSSVFLHLLGWEVNRHIIGPSYWLTEDNTFPSNIQSFAAAQRSYRNWIMDSN
jgi:hypothetical protein